MQVQGVGIRQYWLWVGETWSIGAAVWFTGMEVLMGVLQRMG